MERNSSAKPSKGEQCDRQTLKETMTPTHSSLEAARRFIASVEWRFAKTMAHYNPHWYVVDRDASGPEFTDFVAIVRSGPIRRYRGGRYHCVTVDGWDYWLTHAGADGWIINRKRSAEAGWDDVPPTRDKRELIWHAVERELISKEQAEELLRALED
jgi:hypothetical protein